MQGWQNPDVGCPFYKADNKWEIQCEGLENRSKIVLRYERMAEKKRQIREYCCRNWEMCEINRMLTMLYEAD